MIGVHLMGGLGNQMFQYAAGKALANRRGAELVLDISFFAVNQSRVTPRRFMLDRLRISGRPLILPEQQIDDGTSWSLRGRAKALVSRVLDPAPKRLRRYREGAFGFDPDLSRLPDGTYLDGYWQSYRYFEDIAGVIKSEFTFVDAPDSRNMELAGEIGGLNSVSVHIRRGDYVDNPAVSAVMCSCPIDYYRLCMAEIYDRIGNCHFFIFSDDPDWVRNNLRGPWPVTIVDHNQGQMHPEDLRLMSLCKHNIIANSSFSWWGAWLNANPGKLVFAPVRWFTSVDTNAVELLPPSWIMR